MWDDKKIIKDIQTGKQDGVTYVFHQYGGRLLKFFKWKFQLSQEDAEDVLQETLTQFVISVRKNIFRRDASIFTFLSTIGVNKCVDILKKNKKYRSLLIDDMPTEDIENVAVVSFVEQLHDLLCITKILSLFVEKIKKQCLTVLELQTQGCSTKEVAIAIGRREGATKTFIWECKNKFRQYLQECREGDKQ